MDLHLHQFTQWHFLMAGMALFLGIIGGVGGVLGKEIYYYIKDKKWK